MLKVNYEYKKGFLFVNLEGTLDSKNMYELINSMKVITTWNGINKVVLNIEKVILKSRSPSCGIGKIYSGNFDGELVDGNGICAQLLIDNGIEVINIDDLNELT